MVRLGVMWEAVERAPGSYNATYMDSLEALINKLGDAGIYTLIDMHQDIAARPACGEGMPAFYAKEVLAEGMYCLGKDIDWLLGPVFKAVGFCKSIRDYGYEYTEDDLPKISECQKAFFADYYTSPEALTIFRALYFNEHQL